MTNGLRNHPGPTRIKSYADEQRSARIHRRFWIVYTIAVIVMIAFVLVGCGESASERSANDVRDYGVDKHEHRLRSLEERVTALEVGK